MLFFGVSYKYWRW